MAKHILLFSLLMNLLWTADAEAQKAKVIDWDLLAKVEFKDHYFKELEAWYLKPQFSSQIKKLDSQQVIIEGYMIPLDVDGGIYALSAYPFSSCFFCGGSGPESVMTLKFAKDPRRYETDEVVRFTGTLKLNDSNIDNFIYVLQNAREVQ